MFTVKTERVHFISCLLPYTQNHATLCPAAPPAPATHTKKKKNVREIQCEITTFIAAPHKCTLLLGSKSLKSMRFLRFATLSHKTYHAQTAYDYTIRYDAKDIKLPCHPSLAEPPPQVRYLRCVCAFLLHIAAKKCVCLPRTAHINSYARSISCVVVVDGCFETMRQTIQYIKMCCIYERSRILPYILLSRVPYTFSIFFVRMQKKVAAHIVERSTNIFSHKGNAKKSMKIVKYSTDEYARAKTSKARDCVCGAVVVAAVAGRRRVDASLYMGKLSEVIC